MAQDREINEVHCPNEECNVINTVDEETPKYKKSHPMDIREYMGFVNEVKQGSKKEKVARKSAAKLAHHSIKGR